MEVEKQQLSMKTQKKVKRKIEMQMQMQTQTESESILPFCDNIRTISVRIGSIRASTLH